VAEAFLDYCDILCLLIQVCGEGSTKVVAFDISDVVLLEECSHGLLPFH
jgi:hypothetical protein